jgi:hypothetical protein
MPAGFSFAWDAQTVYAYHMATRTTILLDDDTRRAARDLASKFDCSVSEAVRRAVVRYRDIVVSSGPDQIERRQQALQRAFALFEGSDPDAEIRRLKREDEGF